jgi:glycosyltransferase involved in cell wall biosynthesis
MPRTLLVISASPDAQLAARIAQDRSPRKDYVELARRLAATVLYRDAVQERAWSRIAVRLVGVPAAQALVAFARRGTYDRVFTDAENIGIPLAIMFRLAHVRRRHVMIGHLLSTRSKRLLFRLFGLGAHLDAVICHSSLQRSIIEKELGVPARRIALLPYQVDEQFWRPLERPVSRQLCSAGLEFRDYPTLIAAVEGTDLHVVLAAASNWSKRGNEAAGMTLPANVRVTALDYEHLRELYAASLFTVVPLHNVTFQAGITVILETMAMGKALIVSRTPGQTDVVRDRDGLPDLPKAPAPPGFGATLEREASDIGQTGIYVPPGDADALREAIVYLANRPNEAAAMGANGRRLIERLFTLDQYVDRIAALIAPK